MAKSLISSLVVGDSVVIGNKDIAKKIGGKLAANYKPGTIVYMSAVDIWTQTPGTASAGAYVPGIVEYPLRTSPTFGEVSIDAAISDGTARNCEIIVGPRDGTMKVAVFCKDMGAAFFFGKPMHSSSGGKLDETSVGKMGSHQIQAFVSEDGYANGDTVVAVYWGS